MSMSCLKLKQEVRKSSYQINESFGRGSSWNGKLVSTLRTFRIVTVNRGGTTRTSESPTVTYVEGKPTFGTTNHTLRTKAHVPIHLPDKTKQKILKTLPLKRRHTKILTTQLTVNNTQTYEKKPLRTL